MPALLTKKTTPLINLPQTMLESAYQRKRIKELTHQGYLVIKLHKTSLNGIPDLLCLKDGHAHFIEIKGEHTPITPLQKYRHEQLQEYGFTVKIDRYVP